MVTSGDRDGVGLEVTCKALLALGPQPRARFLITAEASAFRRFTRSLLYKKFRVRFRPVEISDVPMAVAYKVLTDLKSNEVAVLISDSKQKFLEATWVLEAAKLAHAGLISALVTGPVSKERFTALLPGCMGHTALLANLSGKTVFQGYIGPKMAVVLATDHVALEKVEQLVTTKRLREAAEATMELRRLLPPRRRRRPIAWLGLNPHAGEDGLIGRFEQRVHARKMLPRAFGRPVPADTAFSQKALDSTSVYLSLYHDQGLIPFKMLHGQDSGFQISLGLPFIRTSVDHGTAKNLFGKGVANPGSMIDAIEAAMTAAETIKTISRPSRKKK